MSAAEPRRVCGAAAVQALATTRPATILRLFHTEARREVAYPIAAQLAKARKPYRELMLAGGRLNRPPANATA